MSGAKVQPITAAWQRDYTRVQAGKDRACEMLSDEEIRDAMQEAEKNQAIYEQQMQELKAKNPPLPGNLLGQFETDLNNIEIFINRLNSDLVIGLKYHGRNDCKAVAVWSVGNCLIVARVVDLHVTELEMINFRRKPTDIPAKNASDILTGRLKSQYTWKPIPDSERIAKKTLAIFPPRQVYFDQEAEKAWKADQERRQNLTADQAAEEILGAKQSVASTDAGARQGEELTPEGQAALGLRKMAKQLGISVKRLSKNIKIMKG